MKGRWIASAALVLGVSALIPSFAKADGWRDRDRYEREDRYRDSRYHDERSRDDRYRDNHYRDDRFRDFDVDIPLRDVPRNVIDTMECERHGRRIEAVQYVHRDGKFFYRFRIDDPGPRDHDMNIRVGANGRLLSIEEAAQCDPGYGYRR